MRIRQSLCILLLAPSLCIAQQWAENAHSAPAIVVNGLEVKAGPVASMLEAFSKAFNPRQDNVRWPLYAYDVAPLGIEFCREHARELAASGAAFVGRVSNGLTDRSPRYMGIQTTDISWFLGVCSDLIGRQDNFVRVLDDYLSSIEGFGEYLHGGRFETIRLPAEPHDVADSTNDLCVRQLKSGTLAARATAGGGPSGGASTGGHEKLRWTGRVENAEHASVELTWSAVPHSVRSIDDMIASLSTGTEMWQFTPRDPEQFGGHFLISYNDESSRRPDTGNSVTSLWNGDDIEWEGMSGAADYGTGSFDMWYLPPFCGADSDDPWYLVSKYRLGFDRDLGFRAKLFPLRPAARTAALRR